MSKELTLLKKTKTSERKWMLGKCFALKSKNDRRAGDSGYCRVDGFDKRGLRPYGIKIKLSGRKIHRVEFNSPALYAAQISNGRIIPRSRFNRYMENARILTHTPDRNTIREKMHIIKPAHVDYSDKIKGIMPMVLYILKRDADARDDDNLICAMLWEMQGMKMNSNYQTFVRKLIAGEIAPHESICRARRYAQAKYPDLRGKYYKQRHEQEKTLRHQLRMDFFD